jgi:hypothetical protein
MVMKRKDGGGRVPFGCARGSVDLREEDPGDERVGAHQQHLGRVLCTTSSSSSSRRRSGEEEEGGLFLMYNI